MEKNLPPKTQTNNAETYMIVMIYNCANVLVFLCLSVSADPNVILPIGLLLGGATFLFILSVVTYRLFEMDIVLWLRRAFPVLYANTGECRQRLPSALRSCFLCTCSYC